MNTLTMLFTAMSLNYNLPTNLLDSVCYVETKHDMYAIAYNDGGSHSYGVCQIKYETAKHMGFKGTEDELMQPENNIKYAAAFLAYQIKRYKGNTKRAVTAYNKGHSSGSGDSVYYKKVKAAWILIDSPKNAL